MSDISISIPSGESKRLLTGGKYCRADIVVTAEGGVAAPVEEKDVNFYDYDGTLLYAYTLDELQALTELPPLPTQPGLICQGWNWTLEDLKEYAKPYDVMPYYITEDSATWYDLENDIGRDVEVTFRWKQYGEVVTLDFGDGSEPYSNPPGVSGVVVTVKHTYAPGNYRAKLSGFYHVGNTDNATAISDITDSSSTLLKRIFFGRYPRLLYSKSFVNCFKLSTVAVSTYAQISSAQGISGCRNLKALLVNPHEGKTGSGAFSDNSSLKVVSIPNGFTSWYGSAGNRSLKRLCLPDSLTVANGGPGDSDAMTYTNIPNGYASIPPYAFQRCYSLPELTIPVGVTSIGASAFNTCSSLMTLRFLPTEPPAVANANAFTGIPTLCRVEVPAASLEAYQNATNYASIAAQMVGV